MTRRAAGLGLVVLLGLTVPTARLAWAHAYLLKSSPERRAVVTRPPAAVQLWFNERLEPAFSKLSVVDRNGRQVDLRDGRVGPDDPKRLSVGVPSLAPGVYNVRYRVLSVDGHIVESEFSFTVRASQ